MIKKYLHPIVLLSIVILITACGRGGEGQTSKSSFIGGTEAVVSNYEPDSPPAEVTDDSYSFKVVLKLENKGETKISKSDIDIRLVGINPSYFGVTQDKLMNLKPDDDLNPKMRDGNGNIIDGAPTFVTIPSGNDYFKAVPFSGNQDFKVRADICYKYKTIANARLCILKNFINVDGTEICNPSEETTIFSSGSPVQFTNFRESVAGKDTINFFFDVVHSGNGDIYEGNSAAGTSQCPRDDPIRRAKEDRIKVSVDVGEDFKSVLNCPALEGSTLGNPVGFIKLSSGKRSIMCTLKLSEVQHSSDFTNIVTITGEFNYDDNKETSFLVKHLTS